MQKKSNGILARLAKDCVLGAEGYLFELERRGYVSAGPFVPEVVLDHPKALIEFHQELCDAGAEVMVAFTYYADRDKLKTIGREADLEALNENALKIAKKVARKNNVLVAGNICNTWVYDHKNHKKTAKLVRHMYEEQVAWAKEENVDFIIAETISFLGEALIALEVIKKYNLPAMVTLAPHAEKSRDGYAWDDACKILEAEGADIVGLNCMRGPETMLPLLKKIRKKVHCFVAAQPVPYRTTRTTPSFQSLRRNGKRAFPTKLEPFLLTRDEMADFARKAQEIGVNYIGICCGGAPHHVRAMAERLGRRVPASKYSPNLDKHAVLGKKTTVKKHNQALKRIF